MANVKLNFLHVCENSFISQEGKLSIIGVFNQIRFGRLPAVYPVFSIVAGITGEKGTYTEEIQIISPDGELIASIKNEKAEVRESNGATNFIANFAGFVFSKKGKYSVKIKIDGIDKGETTIEIIQIND